MKTDRRIRVVFFTFYFEAWDSLAEIHNIMKQDSRFDVAVISIPRKLTGDPDWHDEDKVSAFLDSRGVEHLRFNFEDSEVGLAKLRELEPDYVFLNYPWQRNYQPAYAVERLAEFTKVCYVPYFSLPLVNEPGVEGVAPHQYTQATHQHAHMVFLQDASVKAALDESGREGHAFLTGTPKIDALLESAKKTKVHWPIVRDVATKPFRLIWAPHHTYAQRWLNFGVFTQMCEEMLEFAKRRSDIDIVMRPHPFLFGTLTDRDLMTHEQVADWRARWDALSNTATDETDSFAAIMLASDALITDGISFIGEYPMVTGKPAIFWEKADHWGFTPLGEIAAETTIRVTNFAQAEAAINAAINGELPERSKEIQALFAAAQPYPGEAAKRIVELVLGDFAG